MKRQRVGRTLRLLLGGVLLVVLLGVWVTHQFPARFTAPRTSIEILRGFFEAPVKMVKDPVRYVFEQVNREGLVLFVRSFDLEEDVESRLVDTLRDEEFRNETIPFVFYLHDLYGAGMTAEDDTLAGLAYAEPPRPETPAGDGMGLSTLVKRSRELRQHVGVALQLYDALFLRKSLEVRENPEDLIGVLEGDALNDLKDLFRKVTDKMFSKSSDALVEEAEQNEYLAEMDRIFSDDERLRPFVECFADFIRDLSNSWLHSFVRREERKKSRLEWVERAIANNRYHEIADYAAAGARRKLVFHLAVDGLQGKLLEGLAQLSMGDRTGAGARYVTELVENHRTELMDPTTHGNKKSLPAALGKDVQELVDRAPNRPGYLETFKKYVFAPTARAVTVNVSTSNTPTISVRNLPIIFSGHGIAGPFGTGIPNFSYLNRQTGRGWYFWGSDVVYMRRIFANREDRIPGGRRRPEGPGARTLFDRLWRHNTVSCMATIDSGALEKISSEIGVAVGEMQRNFIEKAIVLRFRQRAEMERELNRRRLWLMEHRHLSDSFLGSLLTEAI